MQSIVKIENVENRIIELRGEKVLLDSDVAALYDVETRIVNQAVKNNPDKFPDNYIYTLSKEDVDSLRSKILILEKGGRGQHSKYFPKAFTEKGLYMLATILKSKRATETTIAIVETFTKLRELARTMNALPDVKDKTEQKSLMRRSGEIFADLLDDGMQTDSTETTIELNFAVMKVKHTMKRKKKL